MILIYGKDNCPYCDMAKQLCEREKQEHVYLKLGEDFDRLFLMEEFPGARTFPQINFHGDKIGGYTELVEKLK